MIKQIAPALAIAMLLGNVNETNALQLENKVELDEWMNSYEDILAQLDDPEEDEEEMELQDEEEIQLKVEDKADNKEGLAAMNEIMAHLNAIAGEELQTDEQIDLAEKNLLAELDKEGEDIEDLMSEVAALDEEDEDEDDEDLQLDAYGPVEDWNKGICL